MKTHPFEKYLALHGQFLARLERKGTLPTELFAKKDDRGSLYIYDVIGSYFGGIGAEAVARALEAMKDVRALDIFISSPGGDIFEGKTIYADIKRHPAAEKVVHVQGLAASAASFIAMGGTTIKTAKYATWMVHEGSAYAFGPIKLLQAKIDLLAPQNEAMANIYAARTKRPVEEMRALMAAETWMTAEEALAQKFTDEIVDEEEPVEPQKETAAAERFRAAVGANLPTEMQVRLAKQARRLEQLSRSGQPGGQSPTGKP